jgi:hypothetical protein
MLDPFLLVTHFLIKVNRSRIVTHDGQLVILGENAPDPLALFLDGQGPFAGLQHHELCFLIHQLAQKKELFAIAFSDGSDYHWESSLFRLDFRSIS